MENILNTDSSVETKRYEVQIRNAENNEKLFYRNKDYESARDLCDIALKLKSAGGKMIDSDTGIIDFAYGCDSWAIGTIDENFAMARGEVFSER